MGSYDEPLPLTPCMLVGSKCGADAASEAPIDHDQAERRFRYISQLRAKVEKRWAEEYIVSLKSFHNHVSHSCHQEILC